MIRIIHAIRVFWIARVCAGSILLLLACGHDARERSSRPPR